MNCGIWLPKMAKGNLGYIFICASLILILFSICSTQSPVVQRVSKTIFVAKCAVSNKFPLGFLHCSFVETRNKAGILERKFVCPCRKLKPAIPSETQSKECVHFYACILAFISEEKFMNEFSYHIQVFSCSTQSFLVDFNFTKFLSGIECAFSSFGYTRRIN